MVDRLLNLTSRVLLFCATASLALMMVILTWQVFARYVLGSSAAWAEQAALVLMIWMTFLGSAYGISDGFHIRIVEGVIALPEKWRDLAVRLANALVLIAGFLVGWQGLELVSSTWTNSVPTLPLTRGMVYLVVPVSGALMAIFAVEKLVRGDNSLESVSAA